MTQSYRPFVKVLSHSRTSIVDRRANEQYTSSWVDLGNEFSTESYDANIPPLVNLDKRLPAASTSRNAVGGVDHTDIEDAPQDREREHIAPPQPPRRVRDKIERAKTHTIRSISAAIPHFKRRYPRADEPNATASTAQLAFTSPVETNHAETTPREENEIPAIALLYVKDKQCKAADVKNVEQTARELEEIEKLRRDLSESRARIAELQKRYEAQAKDLEGSNNFLSTADKSSDSDIIRALQRLNAEVQQNTTCLADSLAEDFEFEDLTTNPTKEQVLAAQRLSDRMGRILVKSLRTNTPEDIPMLLQIALQAYLASVLCQAASSWVFEAGYNKFIRGMYQRLRRAGEALSPPMGPFSQLTRRSIESQAISGRWRALARVHNTPSWITHPESLITGILTEISDIVLAAGCTAPLTDIITAVTSRFDEKIRLLVELAGRLSQMFDEVISSDFEVFIGLPGEKFKEKMMEDADDGQAGTKESSLLCTTHIGLTKRVPVGTLWEKGKKQKIVVLKAKVLLESFLNAELED